MAQSTLARRGARLLLSEEVPVREAIVRALEKRVSIWSSACQAKCRADYNALYDHKSTIRTVLVREEPKAGVMAEVYGSSPGNQAWQWPKAHFSQGRRWARSKVICPARRCCCSATSPIMPRFSAWSLSIRRGRVWHVGRQRLVLIDHQTDDGRVKSCSRRTMHPACN